MSVAPPKALLIDLDDTLICYDGFGRAPWLEACEAAAVQGPLLEPLVGEIGRHADWYWSDPERHREGRNDLENTRRLIVREALRRLGRPDDRLADEIGDRFSAIRDEWLYLFPGAAETLGALVRRGMPLCLITNGEAHLQRRKIERFRLEPYFTEILIEGELGYGKPDERVFKRALEILGTAAEDTWIIGDNFEWEVVAPGKLGFTCVWVDKRRTGVPAGAAARPHAVIHFFSEVLGLIEAAEAGVS